MRQDTFTGLPPWDRVKFDLLDLKKLASQLLAQINAQRIYYGDKGNKLEEFGKNGELFRSVVIDLYCALAPKFDYHAQAPCVERLKKTDALTLQLEPSKVSFEQALGLFVSLIEFMEVDGVTRFERKDTDPYTTAVADLYQGD